MNSRKRARWLPLAVACLLCCNQAAQGQEKKPPAAGAAGAKKVAALTMKDIRSMLHNQMPTDDIVSQAQAQGIDFKVTAPIQGQLRRLGFDRQQIDAIKACFGIEPGPPPPPVVAGQFLKTSAAERAAFRDTIEKINKASGADLPPVESEHVTFWGAKDLQAQYFPDIPKMEAILRSHFLDPVRSGLDKQTTHVILIKRRDEYEKWMHAYFDLIVSKQPDAPGAASKQDQLKFLLKGGQFVETRFAIICLDASLTTEQVRRMIATFLGDMYFTQLSDLAFDTNALAMGFGSELEAGLLGTPQMVILSISYMTSDRNVRPENASWIKLVQDRIKNDKVTAVGELLKMNTTHMTLPHYAEVWSLVDLLVRDRKNFAKLVLALRTEHSPLKAIEATYGWDEKQLTDEWHKHVLAM